MLMSIGLSDQIRAFAKSRFITPALRDGRRQFSIRVKDILASERIPLRNTPQVCDALMGRRFLRENDLEIEGVDGPPSKRSSTVVIHYRVAQPESAPGYSPQSPAHPEPVTQENASARAVRLTEKLSGILKAELAAYGGSEAFLHWVRSQKDDAA